MYIPPAISTISAPGLPTIPDAPPIKQIDIAARQASQPRSMTSVRNGRIAFISFFGSVLFIFLIWAWANLPGLICCCCVEQCGGKRGQLAPATPAERQEIEQRRTRAYRERVEAREIRRADEEAAAEAIRDAIRLERASESPYPGPMPHETAARRQPQTWLERRRARREWIRRERARRERAEQVEVVPPAPWETRLAQASQRRRDVELTETFQAVADVSTSGSFTVTFPSAPAAVYAENQEVNRYLPDGGPRGDTDPPSQAAAAVSQSAANVGNQAVTRRVPDGEPQGDTDPPPAYEHAPAYAEQ